MRTFMAAIVGLVIIGTAARADDKKGYGATGSATGKVVSVAADGTFVIIADKKGNEHKIHISANTQITADGKAVEGGVKNVKPGSTVTIGWETDTHGNRVGTTIRVMERVAD